VGGEDLRLELLVFDECKLLCLVAFTSAAERLQAAVRAPRESVGHLRHPAGRLASQALRSTEQRLPLAPVERALGGGVELVGDRRQRVGRGVRQRIRERLAGAREQQRTRRGSRERQVRFGHRLLLARAADRSIREPDLPEGLVATGAMLSEPLWAISEQVAWAAPNRSTVRAPNGTFGTVSAPPSRRRGHADAR